MKKAVQTPFSTRQYMLSKDFELYYYSDSSLKSVASHVHNYYEFYFFLEGTVDMQIDDKQYALTYGDVILIPPSIHHMPIIHNTNVPYRRFVFWISQDFYKHLMDKAKAYGYLIELVMAKGCYVQHHDRITFNTIQSKILNLLEEIQGRRFGRDAQLSLCINELILYLNRLAYDRDHPDYQQDAAVLYHNICSFIEEHIEEDLSLDRLSKEFFVSKYYIAHTFKDNIGLSIHQYITKKRLSLCHQAILGDMSITEAYQSFGFGDYSSFYRAFKREYGISPKDFRDMKYIK